MGLLKGLLHRHQEPVDADADDGPAWQELPELDLSGVRAGEELDWARPSKCPSCGAMGYLDRIDIDARITSQHCPWCWAKWDEQFADNP